MTTKSFNVAIGKIGNSQGIVIPKPVLVQLGLDKVTEAEMTIEGSALVLRNPLRVPVAHGGKKGLMLLDQIRAVDKGRLTQKVGTVRAETVDSALTILL